MEREQRKRPDDFIKYALETYTPKVRMPDPSKDFGMYQKLHAAFDGLLEHLENLRRNQGRIGYSSQNAMSDLSKSYIELVRIGGEGSEEELAYIGRAMDILADGLNEAGFKGELAETSNRFARTVWQEKFEAELFGKLWPVVAGKSYSVPDLLHWKSFKGNIQAYLYGFLDVVTELSKGVDKELQKNESLEGGEIEFYERYLGIAESLVLGLSEERHVPGYVINNAFGHWASYSRKLNIAEGAIAHVRRDYNLRRFMARLQQAKV